MIISIRISADDIPVLIPFIFVIKEFLRRHWTSDIINNNLSEGLQPLEGIFPASRAFLSSTRQKAISLVIAYGFLLCTVTGNQVISRDAQFYQFISCLPVAPLIAGIFLPDIERMPRRVIMRTREGI